MNSERPGLRLMIYDATERRWGRLINLSMIWRIGGRLYRLLGRLDHYHGATNWQDALSWLGRIASSQPISEIQFWGHGRWGRALISQEVLDISCLDSRHRLHEHLDTLRRRLVPSGPDAAHPALWWFRTCETFGANDGLAFAQAWSGFFGCRTAGHTHVIGFYQSGLHSLGPGEIPNWSPSEGIVEGDARNPKRAAKSGRAVPNTISCLWGRIPDGW